MLPSWSITSAKRIVTVAPAGPCTRSRAHPVKFCPRSNTASPFGVRMIDTGFSSATRRTGGATGATSSAAGACITVTGVHPASSYGADVHPAWSSRAS